MVEGGKIILKEAGKKIPPIYWLHSNAGINQNLAQMAKAQLDQIGVPRCRFMALPLPVEGADGSPVRAVAIVE